MTTFASSSRLLALGALALLAAGCGDEKSDPGGGSAASPDGQGVEGFFQPQDGETWKYKVQKELPLEIELAEDDAARRPERRDSGYLVTFERVRTCNGTRPLEGVKPALTSMDVFENGRLVGEELYDIGPQGVFFRGWIPAGDGPAHGLLPDGVKLVTPDLQPGQSWNTTGADPDRNFHFRVIERAEIEVPAGKFDALRIQITSDHHGAGLKRTIWFAENIGIVKEEAVYYGPQRTHVRERSELVHFLVPAQTPPREEALTTTPGGDEPTPDQDDSETQPAADVEDGSNPDKSRDGAESPPPDGAKPGS